MISLNDYLVDEITISNFISAKKTNINISNYILKHDNYLFEIKNWGLIYLQLSQELDAEYKEVITELANIIIGKMATFIEEKQNIETNISNLKFIKDKLPLELSCYDFIKYEINYYQKIEFLQFVIPKTKIKYSFSKKLVNQLADLNS